MFGRIYLIFLLILCSGLFSGCTSSDGSNDAPPEEIIKKEYWTGVVYTEKEGVKEFDCSDKIFACRDDEMNGERVLNCLAGEPVGGLQITGGVTNNTLKKTLC